MLSKNLKYILFAVVFAVVIAVAFIGYNYMSGRVETPEGEIVTKKATDFSVTDVSGEDISLSDKFGKPIIINFWATWCVPCKLELPSFNKVYSEYKDSVSFMMIASPDGARETVESVKDFVEEKGYNFPVYFEKNNSASIAYGVSSIPTTVFVNSKGEVTDVYIGAIKESKLRDKIEALLEG